MASVKTHETTYGSIAHCRDGEETDRVSRKKTLTGWLIKVSHFQLIKKQKVVYR